MRPAEVDDLCPFQLVEYVFARNQRLAETLITLSYRTGIFAQADPRKLPSLESMVKRRTNEPKVKPGETYDQAMRRWKR